VGKDSKISPNERLLQLIRPSAKAEEPGDAARKQPIVSKIRARKWRFSAAGRQVQIGVDISPSRLVCVKVRGQDLDYEVLGTANVPLEEGVEPGSDAFVTVLRQTLSGLCADGEKKPDLGRHPEFPGQYPVCDHSQGGVPAGGQCCFLDRQEGNGL